MGDLSGLEEVQVGICLRLWDEWTDFMDSSWQLREFGKTRTTQNGGRRNFRVASLRNHRRFNEIQTWEELWARFFNDKVVWRVRSRSRICDFKLIDCPVSWIIANLKYFSEIRMETKFYILSLFNFEENISKCKKSNIWETGLQGRKWGPSSPRKFSLTQRSFAQMSSNSRSRSLISVNIARTH